MGSLPVHRTFDPVQLSKSGSRCIGEAISEYLRQRAGGGGQELREQHQRRNDPTREPCSMNHQRDCCRDKPVPITMAGRQLPRPPIDRHDVRRAAGSLLRHLRKLEDPLGYRQQAADGEGGRRRRPHATPQRAKVREVFVAVGLGCRSIVKDRPQCPEGCKGQWILSVVVTAERKVEDGGNRDRIVSADRIGCISKLSRNIKILSRMGGK